jgi:hypothetical protein
MAQSPNSFYARYQALAARAQLLPHYRDPTFLEKYAQRYQAQLLKERQTILADQAAFEQDALFLAFLSQVAPDLIEWRGWRMKALVLAEQLDSGHKHHRLTPEEHREKVLAWQRVKALDHMMRILERRRFQVELRDALRTEFADLDEEDMDQIEREFADELSAEPDEDGPYKQL